MRCSARNLCSLSLIAILVIAMGNVPAMLTGQTSDASRSPVASLKDQLEKGLRARRNVEFQFLGQVALLVDQGRLSKDLVQGSFSWTLRKYRKRASLVPYFEQVLRQRAAKEGLTALNNIPTTLPAL